MKISIALVEPQHEINAGYIARVMKNFGLHELLLIDPKFDKEKAKLFAVHGKDLLESAKMVDTKYLKKFDLLIGTTAVQAKSRLNIVRDAIPPEKLPSIIAGGSSVCIVLGRESTGLTNAELKMCNVIVSIDTPSAYKTLNISHALTVLLYEVVAKGRNRKHLSSKRERDLLVAYALRLADKSDYPLHRMEKLKTTMVRIISRSSPTSKETMLLVSLFRSAILTIERGQHLESSVPNKVNIRDLDL